MIDATRAAEWPCTNEEYHATTDYVSHSGLKIFAESPRLYHGRFVAKTIPAPEPTEALTLGTWFHAAVLEPEKFAEIVASCGKLTKPEAKRYDLVARMTQAVLAHPLASMLLSQDGPVEHSIVWRDEVTGLHCKSRRDKLTKDNNGRTIIADLKTSNDPRPEAFARDSHNFRYYRQAPYYLEGHRVLTGEDASFVYIVVGKSEPYEVALYELDEEALALGARENRILLNRLAHCHKIKQWTTPWECQVTKLALPRWAYSRENTLED